MNNLSDTAAACFVLRMYEALGEVFGPYYPAFNYGQRLKMISVVVPSLYSTSAQAGLFDV